MLESELNETAARARGQQVENLLEILTALARRRALLAGLPLAGAGLAVAISFAMPDIYRAQTQLMPPQQSQSGAAALLAQFGGAAAAVAGGAPLKTPNDLYVGMLRSRTVSDNLIRKFDLRKRYGVTSNEDARRELAASTGISSGKEGLISIEVDDRERVMAATLANAYVDELMRLTSTLAVTEAAQRRLFFERQLQQARQNLADAELRLKGAIARDGVAIVEAESQAMAEMIGRLRAQVSAKEIELNANRAVFTPDNPAYKRTQEQLQSLRAELARLQNGQGGAAVEGTRGLKSAELVRDVKYFQMLYELLAKQYEAARLDEAKDTPVVQVLDPAVAPERRAKPRRGLLAVAGAMAGLLLALGWIGAAEGKQRMLRLPGAAQRWAELRSAVRGKKR